MAAFNCVSTGFHQILFVTSGRMTDDEVAAFYLLSSLIYDVDVLKYVTIVRARFPSFKDAIKCETDIQNIKNENAVSNPPCY